MQAELDIYGVLDVAPLAGPRTRSTDPRTSVEATKVITRKGVAKTQEAILRYLRREPMIAEQLENLLCPVLHVKPQRIRTELKNLKDSQPPRVQKAGYGKTSSGVKAEKWRAV